MNERPKVKLKFTKTDKVFEFIGWVALIAFWTLIILNYSNLSDTIPIHYNVLGEADRFGEKNNILHLLLVATAIFLILTLLNKFPHIFSYPTKITKDNALKKYICATRMVRYLKLVIVIISELIALQTIRNVNGQISGLGIWFLPLTLGVILIPLIYFAIKLFNTPNSQ